MVIWGGVWHIKRVNFLLRFLKKNTGSINLTFLLLKGTSFDIFTAGNHTHSFLPGVLTNHKKRQLFLPIFSFFFFSLSFVLNYFIYLLFCFLFMLSSEFCRHIFIFFSISLIIQTIKRKRHISNWWGLS